MDIKRVNEKAPGASKDNAFTIGFKMPVRPIDANALAKMACAYPDFMVMLGREPTLSLNTLRDAIYEDAVAHGLWEDYHIGLSVDLLDECHDLIYDEVDELDNAIEDWANLGNHNRFAEELADVVIMCFSVAGRLGIDIDAAIRRKMEINKNRSWKHGNESDKKGD